ncbi:hypothetical protein DNHGIG_32440 [Collibacillus ludicampi]|uniref:Uncharacterized protein n=1 Tax=Collibacillus ludicampi TaxID=2771369 RepID=A0AAV4LIP3_9BACL|nr:hypothetical protein [Collibacillus ludicampi]GIM47695.1 hypothetical protein DNHGIG_32440 [Collibacillus ludicampi]
MQVNAELADLIYRLTAHGLSPTTAKSVSFYMVLVNAKIASLAHAFQDLFTVLSVTDFIMLLSSIGMTLSGKDRRLVQKEAPSASHIIRELPHKVS